MENLGIGLTLMIVGMVTVFAILLIVINLSKLLICIVNKICPEEVAQKKKAAQAPQEPQAVQQTIDPTVMEVIKATVNKITAGKGIVASVEKV